MFNKVIFAAVLLFASTTTIKAATVNFENLSAGDITTGLTISGVTLTVENQGTVGNSGEARELMIFDGTCGGGPASNCSGEDLDLYFPNFGNFLIISEDNNFLDPDDNALGGDIVFSFDSLVSNISIDVLDVENGGPMDNWVSAILDGVEVSRIFVSSLDNAFDTAIFATDLVADQIIIHLHGSGAVDNLSFTPIPIPAALLLFFTGLLGLFGYRKFSHIF